MENELPQRTRTYQNHHLDSTRWDDLVPREGDIEQAYQFDIRIRLYDDQAPVDGIVLLAEDIGEGVHYDEGGVKVTAFAVDHRPIRPAFGYRIEYAGCRVVLSGDTRVSENLIAHAKGVDLLIHEVVAPEVFRRGGMPSERANRIAAHHTTPEQAGEVFAQTKPRLAVYSHIVPARATADDLVPLTRKTYSGPLEVGEDLMVIKVADEIEVIRNAEQTMLVPQKMDGVVRL